jgi:protein SCO1/2
MSRTTGHSSGAQAAPHRARGLAVTLAWVLSAACSGDAGSSGALPSVDAGTPASLALTDHTGALFDASRLRGEWRLFFFGFTRCPDVCPLTLQQTRAVRDQLAARGVPPPAVVLVTVDPAHDTPEVLRSYLAAFGPAYTGVTGTEAEIARLERWLGATHRAGTPSGPHDAAAHARAVEHTAYLYLIDPDGRLREQVQGVAAADTIAGALLPHLQTSAGRVGAALTRHDKWSQM